MLGEGGSNLVNLTDRGWLCSDGRVTAFSNFLSTSTLIPGLLLNKLPHNRVVGLPWSEQAGI